MAENIVMPQLGESIAEGTIVKWLKEPGDAVKKDENVVLISTDKVEAEIPSPTAGVLVSIAVGAGLTVPVGTVLGQVGIAGDVKKTNPAPIKPETAAPLAPVMAMAEKISPESQPLRQEEDAENGDMRGFLSPLVRRIAHEHGIKESEIESIA